MNIQQNPTFCNNFFVSTLGASNLTPSIWYHKILYKNGKPDSVGITILSELLQLHLSSETREREFQLGYAYFKTKFNYTCDQIYEALLRLEKLQLINRSTRSQQNIKDLFITLNVENLLTLHAESDNNPDEKKGCLEKDSSTLDNPNTSLIRDSSLNIDLYIGINKRDIEDKREEYISGSRFDKNASEQKFNQEQTNPNSNPSVKPEEIMRTSLVLKTARKWVKNLTRQPISSFHPLSEEDAESLRLSSGREFTLHFINQLVLRLGTKYPEHGFYTKKLFMKYLSLTLANEMRQAVNVNNEGFRFKRADDEGVAEEYLAKVEDSRSGSASDQIRRKIAAVFEPTVAYKILTCCYFPDKTNEGRYEIRQRMPLELSESQRDRLYLQISAVFGDKVESIEIIKNFKSVAKTSQPKTFSSAKPAVLSLNTKTLWGRIRANLIAHYGEAIDKSWFSRLETAEDASSRSLILKGASFLTDYIQTNYSPVIERLCREENYNLKFC